MKQQVNLLQNQTYPNLIDLTQQSAQKYSVLLYSTLS